MPQISVTDNELNFFFYKYDVTGSEPVLALIDSTIKNNELIVTAKIDPFQANNINERLTESRIAKVTIELSDGPSYFNSQIMEDIKTHRLQNRFPVSSYTENDSSGKIIRFLEYVINETETVFGSEIKTSYPAWYTNDGNDNYETKKIPFIDYGEKPYLDYDKIYVRKPGRFSNIYFVATKDSVVNFETVFYMGILDIEGVLFDPNQEETLELRFFDGNGLLVDVLNDIEPLTNFKQLQQVNSGIEVNKFLNKVISETFNNYPYKTLFNFSDVFNISEQEIKRFSTGRLKKSFSSGTIDENSFLSFLNEFTEYPFNNSFKQQLLNNYKNFDEGYISNERTFFEIISDTMGLHENLSSNYYNERPVGPAEAELLKIFAIKYSYQANTYIDIVFSQGLNTDYEPGQVIWTYDTSVLSMIKRFKLDYNTSSDSYSLTEIINNNLIDGGLFHSYRFSKYYPTSTVNDGSAAKGLLDVLKDDSMVLPRYKTNNYYTNLTYDSVEIIELGNDYDSTSAINDIIVSLTEPIIALRLAYRRSGLNALSNSISVFNTEVSARQVVDLALLMGVRNLYSLGNRFYVENFFGGGGTFALNAIDEYVVSDVYSFEFQEIEDFSSIEVLEFYEQRNIKNKLKKIYSSIAPSIEEKVEMEYIIPDYPIYIDKVFYLDGKTYFIKSISIEEDTFKVVGFRITLEV